MFEQLFKKNISSFEEAWNRVEDIPKAIREQIKEDLSWKTKKKLAKLQPSVINEVIAQAINEVNKGSVEKIDIIVKRIIRQR